MATLKKKNLSFNFAADKLVHSHGKSDSDSAQWNRRMRFLFKRSCIPTCYNKMSKVCFAKLGSNVFFCPPYPSCSQMFEVLVGEAAVRDTAIFSKPCHHPTDQQSRYGLCAPAPRHSANLASDSQVIYFPAGYCGYFPAN